MPLGPNDPQYEIFGPQGTVYPGHPVSIAFIIMGVYPDYESAYKRGTRYPSALENGAVPGAGGNVYMALDTLKHALQVGVEAGLAYGDEAWARCASGSNFGDRHAPGQAQADGIKERFRELFATWAKAPVPA